MTKKMIYLTFGLIALVPKILNAENASGFYFRVAHEAGVTKCDTAINKVIGSQSSFDIFKIYDSGSGDDILTASPVDKSLKKIEANFVLGNVGDSFLVTLTVIQDVNTCFVSKRTITTFSNTCKNSIDGNYWNKVNDYSTNDYSRYMNPGNVAILAKDIKVGNFNMCIQDTSLDNEYPIDKSAK